MAEKKKTMAELQREKKLAELKERIGRSELVLKTAQEHRKTMMKTDIVGVEVFHKSFGSGRITQNACATVTVEFAPGSKRFVMPDAFLGGFLKTSSPVLNGELARYKELCTRMRKAREDISSARRSIRLLEKK